MRTLLLRSLLIAMLAAPALAAPSTSLEGLKAATYQLDKSHASIVMGVSHLGFSTYLLRFNEFDATLNFNPDFVEDSKLSVTIDLASIDSDDAVLKKKLLSKDFFDAANYPKAAFVSTKIEKLSATTGRVTGNLTLHGVTKPVTLEVTFNGHGPMPMGESVTVIGFSARGAVKCSDFGLTTYLPHVGDTVSLLIETEFHQKK